MIILLRSLPSAVCAVLCAAVAVQVLRLADFDFAAVSPLKRSALALILLTACGFAAAAFFERARKTGNIVIINAVLCLAGAEAALRAAGNLLPVEIVKLLPADERNALLAERGLFTGKNITGENMLYAWRPGASFENLPWIHVDEAGYRNPAQPDGAVDVVFLGDSVTISVNVRRDMAEIFRSRGVSAVNLGFSGYGPPHHLDSYRRHVLGKNIRHKAAAVVFCLCNDVTDAQAYARLKKSGAGWRDYLSPNPNPAAFPFKFRPPWIVSVIFNLPYVLRQNKINARAADAADSGGWSICRAVKSAPQAGICRRRHQTSAPPNGAPRHPRLRKL